MSSLGFLAHTAHAAAPVFNGLFYATIATVIPVLYIALAVQGNAYEPFLRAAIATLYDTPLTDTRRLHLLQWAARFGILYLVACLIVGAGVAAEAGAIYILYEGNVSATEYGFHDLRDNHLPRLGTRHRPCTKVLQGR
jgi:hypothetical protein